MSVVTESSVRIPFGFLDDNRTLHCPRCAAFHVDLPERKLTEPVTLGPVPFHCWATCPTTGDPILLQTDRAGRDRAAADDRAARSVQLGLVPAAPAPRSDDAQP